MRCCAALPFFAIAPPTAPYKPYQPPLWLSVMLPTLADNVAYMPAPGASKGAKWRKPNKGQSRSVGTP
jgi:hypothetical protein